MACWVPDVLFQTFLLVLVDMLFVVLFSADRLKFARIDLTELKLVKGLPKDTLSRHLEWLSRVGCFEATSFVHDLKVIHDGTFIVTMPILICVVARGAFEYACDHGLRGEPTSGDIRQLRVQANANSGSLASQANVVTFELVQLRVQGRSVDLGRILGYLATDRKQVRKKD